MKAILVMEMPENCVCCPLLNGSDECIMQDEDANIVADTLSDLKNGCPLVPMPERKSCTELNEDADEVKLTFACCSGWNACLKAIEGKES